MECADGGGRTEPAASRIASRDLPNAGALRNNGRTMNPTPVRIGTRGSPLALAQANEIRTRLAAAHPALPAEAIEIVVIRTAGDRIQDRTLADIGGKGLFTKEIEEALLDRRIDLAVHSMKDVPTVLPDGLRIAAMPPREDPRDAFLSRGRVRFADLPSGAVVGTAGLRRQAQVLQRRPDLRVVPLRGNVQTRLARLDAGEVDATLLALAGLKRLGMVDTATEILPCDVMLPAVAQGAIGIEIRENDDAVAALVAPLGCAETMIRVTAERALLAALDGSCRTPIAALAEIEGGRLHLDSRLLSTDGGTVWSDRRSGPSALAALIGAEAGAAIRAQQAGAGGAEG